MFGNALIRGAKFLVLHPAHAGSHAMALHVITEKLIMRSVFVFHDLLSLKLQINYSLRGGGWSNSAPLVFLVSCPLFRGHNVTTIRPGERCKPRLKKMPENHTDIILHVVKILNILSKSPCEDNFFRTIVEEMCLSPPRARRG